MEDFQTGFTSIVVMTGVCGWQRSSIPYPLRDPGSDHHHGEGSQEQGEDLAHPFGSPFFQESHDQVRATKYKPHDQEIENETKDR